jgi:hypothetical protein
LKWKKHGIIVPAPPPLHWATSHAALPVVRDSNGSLRLYFSSRDREGRSHIGAGWLDLGQASVALDEDPAITIGSLGAFDDRGVTSSCVVEHAGRWFQYYTGWNLGVTVPFYLAIGLAVSDDGGRTFEKISAAPVLGRNDVDPLLTASPSVLIEGELWRMWYVSASDWHLDNGAPLHRYHVRYAESKDGVAWEPTGRVCIDYRDANETSIARPCVIKDADLYRMWYSTRGSTYRIGYAESTDGLFWTRKDGEIKLAPRSGWDSEMQAYPFVFDHSGKRHMLYSGNRYGATGIGHATLEE